MGMEKSNQPICVSRTCTILGLHILRKYGVRSSPFFFSFLAISIWVTLRGTGRKAKLIYKYRNIMSGRLPSGTGEGCFTLFDAAGRGGLNTCTTCVRTMTALSPNTVNSRMELPRAHRRSIVIRIILPLIYLRIMECAYGVQDLQMEFPSVGGEMCFSLQVMKERLWLLEKAESQTRKGLPKAWILQKPPAAPCTHLHSPAPLVSPPCSVGPPPPSAHRLLHLSRTNYAQASAHAGLNCIFPPRGPTINRFFDCLIAGTITPRNDSRCSRSSRPLVCISSSTWLVSQKQVQIGTPQLRHVGYVLAVLGFLW